MSAQQTGHTKPLGKAAIDNLVDVLRSAGRGAKVTLTSHFTMRAAQRGFTAPEALGVLKRGTIVGGPDFCAEFCNWKFSVQGDHDDGHLVIVAAVSAGERGNIWSGHVMLITGYVR